MVTTCAQLFWLFYETERWNGRRGENTKGKLFIFSEMIFKIRKFRTCFKIERNPKRKGRQEKKIKIREIYLVINNIYNILPKCFKGLDFTGISYHKHSYMKYSLAFFFPLSATHSMWDLSSLTRNRTHAPCSGSILSYWITGESHTYIKYKFSSVQQAKYFYILGSYQNEKNTHFVFFSFLSFP